MMDQAGIIRDLLNWLESHLDQPLSLDHVAIKAGYSKWHLQRMFKDVTQQAIGSYIRARRLSKSAIALRLTSRPILDIALQYHFDSQQTFTRAFKKQFARTPAQYRRTTEWDSSGMCPPINLNGQPLPEARFVTLPAQQLMGIRQNYSCSLDNLADCRHKLNQQFWLNYLGDTKVIPAILYGLSSYQPHKEQEDEQEIFYTTALLVKDVPSTMSGGEPITLPAGEYVQFDYHGAADALQDFIITLYCSCMPMLKLVRRRGEDIEIFYLHEEQRKNPSPASNIHCQYLIPITSPAVQ